LRVSAKTGKWAIQGSNTPSKPPEKQQIQKAGAVKCAVDSGDSAFTSVIASIMALPLTDAEKAQAVRRLMSNNRK
jgi:hypothetical protein